MGIQREWTDRHRMSGGELEPLGLWIMRQAGLDREHYAEVEAQHKRDIASMDNTLAYWKRQAEDAQSDRGFYEKEAKANALALNEARKNLGYSEGERVNLQKLLTEARSERDEARKAYKTLIVTSVNASACEDLMEERDSARAAYKSLVVTSVNASMCDDLVKQRDEARAEIEKLKGELNAAEQEIKIVRARRVQDESLRHAR